VSASIPVVSECAAYNSSQVQNEGTVADYLLYGRLYVPTGRLDALYSTRLSSTLQALVAAISDPRADARQSLTRPASSPRNIMLNLQHDTGRWCTEYTYSAEDSMVGVRVLHNFGKLADESERSGSATLASRAGGMKRIDEEDAMEGGLKGRISAGAEVYFSAKEKSAGVSTGIRFTTLPDATPPSFQPPTETSETSVLPSASSSSVASPHVSQPATTITALFNPMMGHMSGAYTAQVSKDLSLSSRFDFNVYSYESEWTMGAEWWLRPSRSKPASDGTLDDTLTFSSPSLSESPTSPYDVTGVFKARASTSNDIALLWEGRLKNVLVGLGVASNLSSGTKPIKSFGLELSYFSSD